MRSMTDTQVSRDFGAMLDEVEGGETVLVTRGGVPVAQIAAPWRSTAAKRLAEVLEKHPPDPEFGDHLENKMYEIRASMEHSVREWLWDDE